MLRRYITSYNTVVDILTIAKKDTALFMLGHHHSVGSIIYTVSFTHGPDLLVMISL